MFSTENVIQIFVSFQKEADDKEAMSSEGESEMDEDDASDGGAEREGERLTKEMLQVWVKSLSGQVGLSVCLGGWVPISKEFKWSRGLC